LEQENNSLKQQLHDKDDTETALRETLKKETEAIMSNCHQERMQVLAMLKDTLKLQETLVTSALESKYEMMALRIGACENQVTELLGKLQQIQREKVELQKEDEMKFNFENAQHTMRQNETSEKEKVQPTITSPDKSKQSDEVHIEIGTCYYLFML